MIDGKYTVIVPFAIAVQHITSDEIIESDTHHTLSTTLNTLQGGYFQNGTFPGHLTYGDTIGDNTTVTAGTTTYENTRTTTVQDNSSLRCLFYSREIQICTGTVTDFIIISTWGFQHR